MIEGASLANSSGQTIQVPTIQLWGAPAEIPRAKLIERADLTLKTLTAASPQFLLRVCLRRILSWRGWHPSSLRMIHYNSTVEVYAPTEAEGIPR